MKFQVEFLYERDSQAYVIARRLETDDFSVSAKSRLGGVAIRGVTQPRKIRADGTPDLDFYAFVLKDRRDLATFSVGQIVELHQ